MLRILGKDLRISKLTTVIKRSESQIEVAHHVFDDLSDWEFVNPSDDEHEDSYSFTDEPMLKEDDPIDSTDPLEIGSPSSMVSPLQVQLVGALIAYDVRVDDSSNDDDVEEEEEEEDYDDDLDDELVPNWLSDKFGRQRIRKLGKRANSRMNKSKKGPYVFNRPGCVHGKHGLGVQHSYV